LPKSALILLNTGVLMEPGYFPDMLAERPLVIMGKYRGGHAGTITISGYSGNQKYEKIFDLSSVSPQPSNAAIRTLWARQRIQQLTYQMENNSNHPSTESGSRLQKEITALGLRYSLMTQFTSFIAIDEHHIVDKNGKMITVKQALPLPKGVNNRAVGNDEMKSQEEISNTSGIISIADSKGYDEVVGKDIADVKVDIIQVEEEPVLDVVEQMPAYPGGDAAMNQFIGQNMHYPATAQENGIQGTVYLRFQINKDGSVGKVEVLRSLDPACDREAIRIVKSMPRFIPGKQNGGNVAVWYTIPIMFKLN
jgi:TonB family protein